MASASALAVRLRPPRPPRPLRPLRQLRQLRPLFPTLRLFHAPVALAAGRAPSVISKERNKEKNQKWSENTRFVRDHADVDAARQKQLEQAIPRAALAAAYKDRRIDVPVDTATFMGRTICYFFLCVQGLISVAHMEHLLERCPYSSSDGPPNFTSLARVALVLAISEPLNAAATRILRSLAVRVAEPLATMTMALYYRQEEKVSRSERNHYQDALLALANQGVHPHAMMLYSYFADPKDQLFWLEHAHKAARPVPARNGGGGGPGGSCPLAELLPPDVPAPWCAYADALASRNDRQGAMDAIAVGMDTFDAPLAYGRLAQRLAEDMRAGESVQLADYEHLLLKSAMEHNPEACNLLANLYLTVHLEARASPSVTYGRGSEPFTRHHRDDDYRMLAVEWYELAIQAGRYRPAVILAALWRQEGRPLEPVKKYLDLAELDKQSKQMACELRDRWHDHNLEVDIPRLMV